MDEFEGQCESGVHSMQRGDEGDSDNDNKSDQAGSGGSSHGDSSTYGTCTTSSIGGDGNGKADNTRDLISDEEATPIIPGTRKRFRTEEPDEFQAVSKRDIITSAAMIEEATAQFYGFQDSRESECLC